MKLDEIIMASVTEFLNLEVHKETENLDLGSKIEIVQKRIEDIMKNGPNPEINMPPPSKGFEYEMFFSSNPNDLIKIDGWIPIETNKLGDKEQIKHFIEIGLIRRIEPVFA
ncbi:hypothetical protein [Aquimarina brevivitae]|uniref:Uncharacterized protein n=1 Tax=Aquimarina brevivitae TaxID=323412 RepID=A0A4Q7NZ53_9FLAO|nr:hypothetical protein [Aquimarina brevivitae]RZS92537.1 hypothetical protein EV197_2675 [Aquimarina brevivitae]